MRTYVAVALLASSWLFGMGYFQPENLLVWLVLVISGAALLSDEPIALPAWDGRAIAAVALLPAVWWFGWPHRIVPFMLLIGLAATLVPRSNGRLAIPLRGLLVAGLVLGVQAACLALYALVTSRGHHLPDMMAQLLCWALQLFGADSAYDGTWLTVGTTAGMQRFAPTWELLLDPATMSLLSGSVMLWALRACRWGCDQNARTAWLKGAARLALITLVWSLIRAVILVAGVAQLVSWSDPVLFPNVGRLLFNHWLHSGLLLVPVALYAALMVARPHGIRGRRRADRGSGRGNRTVVGVACLAVAIAMLAVVYLWTPIGQPKQGRVLVIERHSTWEPTLEPYGTKTYGEPGSYTYAAAYAYCDQFYQMDRLLESATIDAAALSGCDVLIIKTPTARYTADEVAAIVQFVANGGSALLIGDHTNVFNMNTYLNDISRHFGFTFRNDLLFKIGSPYAQRYEPPDAPHPILFHVPPMQFAVSCSIDPGWSLGREVIHNVGLYNLPPAYQESNYHPQAEYRPYMEYGAWCQLWATTSGRGRVAAFADSTLFSNFCVYQPGKRELLMGMLQWLNHRSMWDQAGWYVLFVGIIVFVAGVLGIVGIWSSSGYRGRLLLLVACGLGSWSVASGIVGIAARHDFTPPAPTRHRLPHVVIDRECSVVPLFTGAFADDKEGNGYGLLEQWIPRIGNYSSRATGAALFAGDALVVICPTRLPSPAYRAALVEWVRNGGRLLVFDSPDVEESTANSWLALFGLNSTPANVEPEDRELKIVGFEKPVPSLATCAIAGGESLATWGDTVAAARTKFGKGTVTVIGFGSLFNDNAMGSHWLVEPEPDVLLRYDALYALLRHALPYTPPGKAFKATAGP